MPTIEEDLATISGTMVPRAAWEEAFTRIRAALADREHLEKAARIAYNHLDYRTANRRPLSGGEEAWLEAERVRQSRRGGE